MSDRSSKVSVASRGSRGGRSSASKKVSSSAPHLQQSHPSFSSPHTRPKPNPPQKKQQHKLQHDETKTEATPPITAQPSLESSPETSPEASVEASSSDHEEWLSNQIEGMVNSKGKSAVVADANNGGHKTDDEEIKSLISKASRDSKSRAGSFASTYDSDYLSEGEVSTMEL